MIIRLLSTNFPQGGVNLTQWSLPKGRERGDEVLGEGGNKLPSPPAI